VALGLAVRFTQGRVGGGSDLALLAVEGLVLGLALGLVLLALYDLLSHASREGFSQWQTSWWGVLLLGGAGLLLLASAYLSFDFLAAVALLPCLAGFAVLLGGRNALRWAWPAVAFLAFMIPLPYQVAHAMSGPLQNVTTKCSGLTLQTLGLPALVEGNTILLDGSAINVVEACSGLSMLMVFCALATATAIVVRRPPLDRVIIVLSAVPIAIVANVVRVSATGVAQYTVGVEFAQHLFHDWAGWLMIVLAVGMLLLVIKLLDVLLIQPPDHNPRAQVSAGHPGGPALTPPPPSRGSARRGRWAASLHRSGR
jgi:exosortase